VGKKDPSGQVPFVLTNEMDLFAGVFLYIKIKMEFENS
jgi:hypothetical protein